MMVLEFPLEEVSVNATMVKPVACSQVRLRSDFMGLEYLQVSVRCR